MSMTINQIKTLFENIANAHKQIQDFEFGEVWEIEEKMNKEAKYPMLYVAPIQTLDNEQVFERSFHVFVFDMLSKDKSNVVDAWSDTEQILYDVIKIFKNESANYEVVGQSTLLPFKEDNSDWAIGYRTELVIRTDANSNYCDIPSDTFVSPNTPAFAQVKDQNGNVLATLYSGDTYSVIVASGILDDLNATVTVIDNI
jgi:hypothetical protein